jgi:hypothetical protein
MVAPRETRGRDSGRSVRSGRARHARDRARPIVTGALIHGDLWLPPQPKLCVDHARAAATQRPDDQGRSSSTHATIGYLSHRFGDRTCAASAERIRTDLRDPPAPAIARYRRVVRVRPARVPQHGAVRPALAWSCTALTRRDVARFATTSGVRSSTRPSTGGSGRACSGRPVRSRGVDVAEFGGAGGVSEQSPRGSTGDRSSSDGGCVCGILGPAMVSGVRRRSLWLDRAGVRWALTVPLRESSDASPRTSSRCSPAPSVRWKQLSSAPV